MSLRYCCCCYNYYAHHHFLSLLREEERRKISLLPSLPLLPFRESKSAMNDHFCGDGKCERWRGMYSEERWRGQPKQDHKCHSCSLFMREFLHLLSHLDHGERWERHLKRRTSGESWNYRTIYDDHDIFRLKNNNFKLGEDSASFINERGNIRQTVREIMSLEFLPSLLSFTLRLHPYLTIYYFTRGRRCCWWKTHSTFSSIPSLIL